jgi:hypothetical protein
MPSDQFQFRDAWTDRAEREKEKPRLAYVIPVYHVLIPKPADEVRNERLLIFDAEERNFLEEWPKTAQSLPALRQHSDTWKTILSGLAEMLKEKHG